MFAFKFYKLFWTLTVFPFLCRSQSKQVIIKRALFILSDTYLHHLCFIAINEMTLKRNIDGNVKRWRCLFYVHQCAFGASCTRTMSLPASFPVGWMNVILVYFWLKNETDIEFKSFVFLPPEKKNVFHEKLSISCPRNRFVSNYVLWCALLYRSNSKSHELWFSPYAFRFRLLSEHSLA